MPRLRDRHEVVQPRRIERVKRAALHRKLGILRKQAALPQLLHEPRRAGAEHHRPQMPQHAVRDVKCDVAGEAAEAVRLLQQQARGDPRARAELQDPLRARTAACGEHPVDRLQRVC